MVPPPTFETLGMYVDYEGPPNPGYGAEVAFICASGKLMVAKEVAIEG
jgi:hypothetical protein